MYIKHDLVLETDRLFLRRMRPEDIDDLLRIFTDPQVMASFGGELFDRAQMERWLAGNLEHQERYGYGLFAVILKSNGEFIGDCGLEHMEVEGERETELGYDFRSDYWNQGLATEAASAVREFAFGTLELTRLISLIRVGNQASRRVAEKVGMTLHEEIERYGRPYWVYVIARPGVEGERNA
ncbi:MAG: GNAT family N-acetyltransferase [Anaerolineales bacterium]